MPATIIMSELQYRKVERKKARVRLGLSGPAGSGKTLTALLIAYGITGDWSKIALIDSENESADLYDQKYLPEYGLTVGEFNVIPLSAPYHPDRYIQSIDLCLKHGAEVIIIDSITHEWNGVGGCLELHDVEVSKQRTQNGFTAWAKVTPLHQKFVDRILTAPVHIITTVRSKSDYILTEKNGKQVPQKVGMAAQTREGFEYELTVSLDLDINHLALSSKDRTGLFADKPAFVPNVMTGKAIRDWCDLGVTESIKRLPITDAMLDKAIERIVNGEHGIKEKVKSTYSLTDDQRKKLEEAKPKAA